MEVKSWQELEEITKNVLEANNFNVEFRKVFKNTERKFEIDVLAEGSAYAIAIECKFYRRGNRTSSLKSQAKKHYERCQEHEKLYGKKVIPVIVSWLDDAILINNGCIFVPFKALNDFLINLDYYLEILERFIIV